MKKKCFKCQEEKNREDFYQHKAMADGLLGKCKECTKKDVRERRFGDKREYVLAYDRDRSKKDERKAFRNETTRAWKAKNKEKISAHQKLSYAIATGKITPWPVCCVPECEKKPEAHHYDYSKPLDVIWLCSAHHKQTHALIESCYRPKQERT